MKRMGMVLMVVVGAAWAQEAVPPLDTSKHLVPLTDFVNSGRFPFPVSEAAMDPRLLPATAVLAVRVGGAARAYPIEALGRRAIQETQSTWDLAGRAVDGPLKGQRLELLPTRTTFWFAIVAAEPGITVYVPGANDLP